MYVCAIGSVRECMHSCVRACVCARMEALTAMLACAAERMDSAPQRLFERPLGGGRGAAGEERRCGGEDECEHRARLRPLSISLTHAHAECIWLPVGNVPVCMPLQLCLETALRLDGLSAIANTRLGQSDSGPQRVTGHNQSLQRVQDVSNDLSPSHILADVTEARDALSRHCYRGRHVASFTGVDGALASEYHGPGGPG
jgi:hypothetical protein